MSVMQGQPNNMIEIEEKKKRRKRKRFRLKDKGSLGKSSSTSEGDKPGVSGPQTGASDNRDIFNSCIRVKGMGCMMVQGKIEGNLLNWKVDTGARSTFITKDTFEIMVDKPVLQPVENTYVTANGQKLECLGKASMTLTFGENTFEHEVIVGGVGSNLLGEILYPYIDVSGIMMKIV